MELMQLEMFVAVVEQRSINKAADKVFRTQPAISIALRKLENEIGAGLIHRSRPCDYKLTPAGELFYSYATRLLNLRNEAVVALTDLKQLRRGAVRIGADESTSIYLLPQLVHAFRQHHPEIKIDVSSGHSQQLVCELEERRLDIALLAYRPQQHDFDARLIMHDELVLIVNPKHHLTNISQVHVCDLTSEAVVIEGPASSLHDKVVDTFRLHHTTLNVQVEAANIETVKKMVARGVGIAFVPLICVQEDVMEGTLVVIPVIGLQHRLSLWAVRRYDTESHATVAFMRLVNSLSENVETLGTVNDRQPPESAAVVDLKLRRNGLRRLN